MKNKTYILNTLLAAVLGLVLTIAVLVRTFAPAVIIPDLNIPNMVLISLVALLLDHYLVKQTKRCYLCIPLFSAITFGVLPFSACFVGAGKALKLGLVGAVTFTVATLLFTSMQDRLSSGPAAKAAPIITALCLYLAAQAFSGILL